MRWLNYRQFALPGGDLAFVTHRKRDARGAYGPCDRRVATGAGRMSIARLRLAGLRPCAAVRGSRPRWPCVEGCLMQSRYAQCMPLALPDRSKFALSEEPAMTISAAERFGTAPDGTAVYRVKLQNAMACAYIMTWGGSLQDFRLAGLSHSLVLGSSALEPYFTVMRHFGAIAGRVANRLAGGQVSIAGRRYVLERNEAGRTTLHGGADGSSKTNWTLEGYDAAQCCVSCVMQDGQAGFPGNLAIQATYRLDVDGSLELDLQCTTDAPTLCNLAHHSYWNLDGAPTIAGHTLEIAADRYLPVNDDKIPIGQTQAVAGSAFDFRSPRPIATNAAVRLDHNFCLRQQGRLSPVCRLVGQSGTALTIATTEPGLQVYDGAAIATAPACGHGGQPYGMHAGLALEPQKWPDAPNQPGFPSIELHPGQTYRQISRFSPTKPPAGA